MNAFCNELFSKIVFFRVYEIDKNRGKQTFFSIFRRIFAIITYFIVVRPFPVCIIQFIPFY